MVDIQTEKEREIYIFADGPDSSHRARCKVWICTGALKPCNAKSKWHGALIPIGAKGGEDFRF